MSRLVRCAFALLIVVLVPLGCAREGTTPSGATLPPDPTVVKTSAGTVRGVATLNRRLFAGIPYAAPPVGPLRWQPPAPVAPWQGLRDATKIGPRCLQDDGSDIEMGKQTDEDCLTLNVWTPPPTNELRPVMVWIHGGAFINGSGGIYDSRWMVDRGNVIVVTLNYRLGALGFLAHPALGPAGSVGNYGLQDQQAALRWVHDNISAFGGDPDKVTIAGESAGGMSVCDHMVAPDSQGLFRAAIIQSAPCQDALALPDAERISEKYAHDAGCADPATVAACLRALPADKLRKPVWYSRLGEDRLSGPVTGTTVLPENPMAVFAAGRAPDMPVLVGSNRDEFTLSVALQYLRAGKGYTPADYPGLLANSFGPDAPAVEAHYPLNRFGGSAALAFAATVTDSAFSCVAGRITDELTPKSDVYTYEFNDPAPPTPEPMRNLPFPVGASHSLELRYLFDIGGAPPLNPAQQQLSNQMIDYWTRFVANGDPKVDGAPEWPEAGEDLAAIKRLSLQPDGSRVSSDFEKVHQCEFWAGIRR